VIDVAADDHFGYLATWFGLQIGISGPFKAHFTKRALAYGVELGRRVESGKPRETTQLRAR
jgi:hypothetical protein